MSSSPHSASKYGNIFVSGNLLPLCGENKGAIHALSILHFVDDPVTITAGGRSGWNIRSRKCEINCSCICWLIVSSGQPALSIFPRSQRSHAPLSVRLALGTEIFETENFPSAFFASSFRP